MNNLQKLAIATTFGSLSFLTLATQAQAQETYNQPFSGTVTGTCVFNDVSDGSPETLTYNSATYVFDDPIDNTADFSVTCPASSTVSVGAPQQTGGPAITANLENSFGGIQGVGVPIFADTSGSTDTVPGNSLTEFDVQLGLDYDAPLVPGNYEFVVPVTFTPI